MERCFPESKKKSIVILREEKGEENGEQWGETIGFGMFCGPIEAKEEMAEFRI